jgi:hypothetical protein
MDMDPGGILEIMKPKKIESDRKKQELLRSKKQIVYDGTKSALDNCFKEACEFPVDVWEAFNYYRNTSASGPASDRTDSSIEGFLEVLNLILNRYNLDSSTSARYEARIDSYIDNEEEYKTINVYLMDEVVVKE